jgi:hypothetical protein
MMSRRAHWESLYSKEENEVSRFRENPAPSLDLIAGVCATTGSAVDITSRSVNPRHRD